MRRILRIPAAEWDALPWWERRLIKTKLKEELESAAEGSDEQEGGAGAGRQSIPDEAGMSALKAAVGVNRV